jgi:hypothetical protein
MRQQINETKRLQELAGISSKQDISNPEFLKKYLKINKHEDLYNDIINIPTSDAIKVALGMELIANNFDCSPNGAVIFDIIEYLKQKK